LTSILALAARSFSAKVFGGEIAGVFMAFLGFGATRFWAAFSGVLLGGDVFFVAFFFAGFGGALDFFAGVRAVDFAGVFAFFFFFDAMLDLHAEVRISPCPRKGAKRDTGISPVTMSALTRALEARA
jgi:hypothetical protein